MSFDGISCFVNRIISNHKNDMWVQLVSKIYNSAKSCNISFQDHPRLTKSSAFSVKNPPWPDRILN
jgi:hypothetical protein